jgi:hypothetical protein
MVHTFGFFYMAYNVTFFFTTLEKERPEKFKELGKPSLFFWKNSPETDSLAYSFLTKREYTSLNSRKITIIGNISLIILFMGPGFILLLFLIDVFFY